MDDAIFSDEYIQWVESNGVCHSKLRPGLSKIGRTVFATTDIECSEVYASIPLHMVLTCAAAEASPTGQAALSLNKAGEPITIPSRVVLYLFMISQRANQRGYWGPYLRSLPRSYDDPLWWSDEELAMLKGTNLEATVPHILAMLRASYDA